MVLVHGAWHGGWCWDDVVAELERRAIPVTAVELPLSGLADDAAAARDAIEAAGPDCIVVGHSYGGTVITEAAAGLPVGRLIYLAAFMAESGEDTIAYLSGSELLASLVIDGEGIKVDPALAPALFYADADPETVAAAIARLRPMPLSGEAPAPTEAAWHTVPTTYVVCTNDQALPVPSQHVMAARAKEMVEWPTDHSPFLTRPGDVADLISRYAG